MISVEEVLSVWWSGGPALRRERPQCSRRIGSMVRLEPVGLRDLSLVKVRRGDMISELSCLCFSLRSVCCGGRFRLGLRSGLWELC